MKVKRYETIHNLPSGYKLLFKKAEPLSFDQTWPWFETFAATAINAAYIPTFYCVEPNSPSDIPLAVLPMCQQGPIRGITKPRKLTALSNYYTSLFGLIIDRSRAEVSEILHGIFDFMISENSQWDVIDLNPLDNLSADFGKLAEAMEQAGLIVAPYFRFGNWYLNVAGRTYEQYLKTLPSVLRNTLTRKLKSLGKNWKSRVQITSHVSQVTTAISDYEKVYNRSWKKAEPFPDFVPDLARTLSKTGWLRLGILYVEQEPIAAQIWIVKDTTASIFKLAYDKRFASLSPGSILSSELMKHVIDVDKVEVVDYLIGDDPYKRDWMSNRRERWGIMAFNRRTARGVTLALKEKYASKLKKRIFRHRAAP
jgi:hypothetical protein